MLILDGKGRGNQAGVDAQNRLETLAVSLPLDEHINLRDAAVWSVPFEDIDPTDTDDYFIYIKNTGETVLILNDIRVASTVVGQVELHRVSGTAAGGSDITAVSRNFTRSTTPSAILQTGSDITGLSNDGILAFIQLDAVNKEEHLHLDSTIIISPNTSLALLWEPNTGILTGMITIVELADTADL